MLVTNICGIELDSCIMNASGCLCTSEEELNKLYESESGAVVSKSSTMEARSGNLLPRLYMNEWGSVNSMGLPNFGYKFYLDYYKGRIDNKKPFIQSIHPFNLEELDVMLRELDMVERKRLVEINVTCPNIIGNETSFEKYEKYMKRVKDINLKNIICGFKLAPLFELEHFDVMSEIIIKNDVKFITCINSLSNGMMVNLEKESTVIYPKEGLGGIGGVYCKPIGLSNVYNFYKRVGNKVNIVGCGGVSSGKDVVEYLLCGAKAVQVGTSLVKEGIDCFERLDSEVSEIMKGKKCERVEEIMGRIKVIESS